MTMSTEKGRRDEKQPDEMRDTTVKYLWSSPKAMLWGRRNQQKNIKWESGSVLWLCTCLAGKVFVFFHTVISLWKHCHGSYSSSTRDCWVILRLYRWKGQVTAHGHGLTLKQNNTAFCYASDLLHTLMYTIFPICLEGKWSHTETSIFLACIPVQPSI